MQHSLMIKDAVEGTTVVGDDHADRIRCNSAQVTVVVVVVVEMFKDCCDASVGRRSDELDFLMCRFESSRAGGENETSFWAKTRLVR